MTDKELESLTWYALVVILGIAILAASILAYNRIIQPWWAMLIQG